MASTTRFQVYKDKSGQFRWRLLSRNSEMVASGEGYKNKRDVVNAVKKLKVWASTTVINDDTVAKVASKKK